MKLIFKINSAGNKVQFNQNITVNKPVMEFPGNDGELGRDD